MNEPRDVVVGESGPAGAVAARPVVDASGQRRLLARAHGRVEDVPDRRATAAYADRHGPGGEPGPLGRHARRVVTLDDGWAWFIPISPTRAGVGGAVRDRERLGEEDAARVVDPILSGGVDFAIRGAANAAVGVARALAGEAAALAACGPRLAERGSRVPAPGPALVRQQPLGAGLLLGGAPGAGGRRGEHPAPGLRVPHPRGRAADAPLAIFDDGQVREMFQARGVDRRRQGAAIRRRGGGEA